ncbi:MAG: DUF1501 domain-containing protein, partial [Planctomycetes bacterium]|nr:DUF1501 domain-containing protein [Planctomycetota bacterium]
MKEERLLSRRSTLKMGLLGAAGLAVPWPAFPRAWAGDTDRPARARAVIQIWMWGGPCHIDTFDPKPAAGYDFAGPLKAVPTNVDGVQIGELLPLLAQQAHRYSIIRSMTHGVNAHETASYVTLTGRTPGRLVYPSAGAVVSLFKGYDHGYKGVVPPYVVLTTPQGRFSEEGFLGERHKPFATGGDPNRPRFEVEGIVPPGITDERQEDRLRL